MSQLSGQHRLEPPSGTAADVGGRSTGTDGINKFQILTDKVKSSDFKTGLASGIYLIHLKADGVLRATRKLVLLR